MTRSVEEHELRDLYDFSQWPLLLARLPGYEDFKDGGMTRWIAGFDLALSRDEPFVVILDLEAFLKDPREDPEQKKQGAMAMKRIRKRYNELCRGNIYVVADPEIRKTVEQDIAPDSTKFSFPFLAVPDIEAAKTLALKLLAT